MVNWNKVKMDTSNWLKIADGETKIVQFISEPKETISKKFETTQHELRVRVGKDEFNWSISNKLLLLIGECLGRPEFITGKSVSVSRIGVGNDTKYKVVKV